ncbi:nitroreductase family protein [Patescibacteria group bacterium]
MANAHVLEKGLSFEDARVKFGSDTVDTLCVLIKNYSKQKYPSDNFAFNSAINVLQDYLTFHRDRNVSLGEVEKIIQAFSDYKRPSYKSSTKLISSKKYFKGDNFSSVIRNRKSIRNFSDKTVNISEVKKAVKLALNSPSVCNRQSWHVYALRNKHTINKVLDLQTGNRGFRDKIKLLLIVTSDLNTFQGFNERNQCFIDGGLFSMSLLLSLHHYKLATCPLNWSNNFDEDLRIRKVLKIRRSENIIMFMAVGKMISKVKVPRSEKKDITNGFSLLF